VIGTASAKNVDFLKKLGVDQVIDYTSTPFEEVVHGVDVVLDCVGGDTQQRSYQTLRPGGILVSLVETPSEEKAAEYGVRVSFPYIQMDSKILAEIASLVDSGRVRPEVSTVLPLQEIQQAHALSESLHTRGKIVLNMVA
jgi:NADPH:quinone reductase-like Zn-dependent oxidoreductase